MPMEERGCQGWERRHLGANMDETTLALKFCFVGFKYWSPNRNPVIKPWGWGCGRAHRHPHLLCALVVVVCCELAVTFEWCCQFGVMAESGDVRNVDHQLSCLSSVAFINTSSCRSILRGPATPNCCIQQPPALPDWRIAWVASPFRRISLHFSTLPVLHLFTLSAIWIESLSDLMYHLMGVINMILL